MFCEPGRGQLHIEPNTRQIFLPRHITTVVRTGRKIVRYSSDKGLWQRPTEMPR